MLEGNASGDIARMITFSNPFVTKALRVIPVARNELSCMTVELYGCGEFPDGWRTEATGLGYHGSRHQIQEIEPRRLIGNVQLMLLEEE